ncbi:hypothetical protein EHE19_011885 [Ruminiclostridium herbifermentans]|uniref:Galactose oxidase n=1 Tax=Ruminiclostridium herbifermentans TaxID=2488810 RepID=A0A4U7JD09_9FIRM|nr:kelch repeat-containing protein [Ruminiclostridium herbifermentans]QNU65622.1 hypothetical protein EHE19_011885 [Ruminiclostridium herbifermentans]
MKSHKKCRKILALLLAIAITASGVIFNFPVENGKVVQFGGEIAKAETSPWTQKASAPEALSGHSAVAINGKMYVFGGVTASNYRSSSLYEYDPTTDIWTEKISSGPRGRDQSRYA